MTRRISMQIMCELSDAQNLMMTNNSDNIKEANKKMNFVKLLIVNYPDTNVEETEEKLNELYNSLKND